MRRETFARSTVRASGFQITSTGTFTSLHSFTGGDGGDYPLGGLIQGGDGKLYGTSSGHLTRSYGTIFQISQSGHAAAGCPAKGLCTVG